MRVSMAMRRPMSVTLSIPVHAPVMALRQRMSVAGAVAVAMCMPMS